jgi:hypothetical protein
MMTKFSHKLKDKDEFLYNRIQELDLKPQFYAFRWLTLLLSQEFPLPGMLSLAACCVSLAGILFGSAHVDCTVFKCKVDYIDVWLFKK